jgi:uncharacterized protein (UPF0333 family)
MIIEKTNPNQVVLEVLASNPDGSQKLDVVSAKVRIYHIVGGVEVEDLTTTDLVQIGATNVWRYVWIPVSLAVNSYIAEYTLVDGDGLTGVSGENIVIGYLESKVDDIATDVRLIKEIETGRWKIVSDQLILYKSDNITEVARFNLFDATGAPTSDSPADRIKV